MNKVGGFFCRFTGASIAYQLMDQGLADTLALETLRHGTNVINNLRIRVMGGCPSKSCDPSGSTYGTPLYSSDIQNKKYFFLFKDTQSLPSFIAMTSTSSENGSECQKPSYKQIVCHSIVLRIFPRRHAILSSNNMLSTQLSSGIIYQQEKFIPQAFLASFISPTLLFRFSHIDPVRLEDDPNYSSMAYRTEQVVEPWRLGPIGSLLTGVNLDVISRAEKKPEKVAMGIAQLAIGACLAKKLIKNASKQAIIPIALGCLLA